MIVRVDAGVGPARLAQQFGGAVGQHFVGVHVVRGAGAGLIHVDDELIAETAGQDFVGGGDDGARDLAVETAESGVRLGGRLLHEDGGGDEIGGSAQTADRKVFNRPGGLSAVVRVRGHLHFAQRIALDTVCHRGWRLGTEAENSSQPRAPASASSKYTARMLPQFFDSVFQLIVRTSTDLPPDVRASMGTALKGSRLTREPDRR